jgi:hypothetical protein
MLLTPIAYATLPNDVRVAKLAALLRQEVGDHITKIKARALVCEQLGRGSTVLAEAVYTEAYRQRPIAAQRRQARSVDDAWGAEYLKYRLHYRLVANVCKVYDACGYRRAKGRWVGGEHDLKVAVIGVDDAPGIGFPTVRSSTHKVWNRKWGGINSAHTIYVWPTWLSVVYRAGLAVIQGKMVLHSNPVEDDPAACYVWYVTQGRGTSIQSEHGIAVRKGDRWRIKKS